jgi:predicted nucleic acid-binding protein
MATKPVFVGTHGFFVRADAARDKHACAASLLVHRDRRFVTTEWVVVETGNLFVVRRKPHWAEALFGMLSTTRAVQVIPAPSEHLSEAESLWMKFRDHAFPFTDCTSFVVMRELGLVDALTADRHFLAMGFNPMLAVWTAAAQRTRR